MTRLDDRLARVAAAVDRAFGEGVRILRFKPAGQVKAPQPDPDRAPLDVAAKFFAAAAIEKPDATKSGRKRIITDVLGVADRATIALSAFAGPAEWPVQGDRLQRLDLDGQPSLEVLTAAPDASGRLTVMLGRVTP